LPEHGIKVVDLSYFDFEHTGNRRLKRIKAKDIEIVRFILQKQGFS